MEKARFNDAMRHALRLRLINSMQDIQSYMINMCNHSANIIMMIRNDQPIYICFDISYQDKFMIKYEVKTSINITSQLIPFIADGYKLS